MKDPQDTPVLKELQEFLKWHHRQYCHSQDAWLPKMTEPFPCDCSLREVIENIEILIATKQTEARIDEVEKINKHGQTVGAIGYRHYLEGRIAELRNTKVENPNLATSKSQHTNPSGTLSMPQPEVEK